MIKILVRDIDIPAGERLSFEIDEKRGYVAYLNIRTGIGRLVCDVDQPQSANAKWNTWGQRLEFKYELFHAYFRFLDIRPTLGLASESEVTRLCARFILKYNEEYLRV